VIISAAIHAREHLSCDVVCKMIQKLVSEKPYLQFNVAFVPLLNPDGADLCKNGVKNLKKPQKSAC